MNASPIPEDGPDLRPLETACRHASVALFVVDGRRHCIALNPAAERLVGRAIGELRGRPLLDLIRPRRAEDPTGPPGIDPIDRAFSLGERVRGESEFLHRDGRAFPVAFTTTPIDEPGSPAGLVVEVHDLTERRRADAEALGYRHLTESVIRHMAGGVALLDADLRFRLVNPAYQALAPGRPMVGRALGEVWPEVGSSLVRACRRVLETGEPYAAVEESHDLGRPGLEPVERRSFSWSMDRIALPDGAGPGLLITGRETTDQKRVEEALREDERRYRSLFEANPQPMWVYDLATLRFLAVNDAAVAHYGYSRDEFLGMTIADIRPEEDIPRLLEAVRMVGADLRPARHWRHRKRDGTIIEVEITSHSLEFDGHRASLVLAHDLTERLRAEAEVAALVQRLRTLVDHTPLAVVEWDADFVVSRWSGQAEALFGWSAEEVIGRPVATLPIIFEPERRKVDAAVAGLLDPANKFIVSSNRNLTKTGEVVSCEWYNSALHDPRGRMAAVLSLVLDVTERDRAEAHLRLLAEAGAILAEVQDLPSMLQRVARLALPTLADWCLVHLVSEAGELDRVAAAHRDPGLESLLGPSSPRPVEADDPRSLIDRALRTAEPVRASGADELRTSAGGRDAEDLGLVEGLGPGEVVVVPLVIRGRAVGTMGFVRGESASPFRVEELTVARELGRRASTAVDTSRLIADIKGADRRKDEFLATLAHELRNPLAPIRNSLLLLGGATSLAVLDEARGVMERQLGQMVRLIDDLLDVSRITRGKIPLRLERVDLATAVQTAVEAALPAIEASAHELTITHPAAPIHLDADPTRLAQILSNLLTNAAKYTDRGGHLRVVSGREGGDAVISVRDDGIGIAPEHLPHVFDMFSQVAPALERSQGGLGIGLALVKGLVELHGGRVEARSDGPGRGSEFVVRLPVSVGLEPEAKGNPPDPRSAGRGPGIRILVVDDSRDNALTLKAVLRVLGHEVRTAHDGVEGVEAAEQFRPALILLDIGMPRMNGYEAAEQIRRQPWGAAVVLAALTGWGQEDDKRRAAEAGFDYHLTKPVDPQALDQLLANLAGRDPR